MAGWKTGWILDQVDVSIPVVPPVPIVLHRGLNGTGIQDDKDAWFRRGVVYICAWNSSAGRRSAQKPSPNGATDIIAQGGVSGANATLG